jgi:hypothetical protein
VSAERRPVGRYRAPTTSPKERTRRYSIEIKDASGRSVWFAAADWTDEERRIKGSIKLSFGHQH